MDSRARDIVASMNSARVAMTQKCAESLRAPDEKNIDRLIWYGIARYANANVENDDVFPKHSLRFRHLVRFA